MIKDHVMFDFQDPKVPRLRRVPFRLQSSEGDEQFVFEEAFELYKVDSFYSSLDAVITELDARFSENDLEILSALSDVVMSCSPSIESYVLVSQYYGIDSEMLMVEHDLCFFI